MRRATGVLVAGKARRGEKTVESVKLSFEKNPKGEQLAKREVKILRFSEMVLGEKKSDTEGEAEGRFVQEQWAYASAERTGDCSSICCSVLIYSAIPNYVVVVVVVVVVVLSFFYILQRFLLLHLPRLFAHWHAPRGD